MRIKENFHQDHEYYCQELHKSVISVLQYTSHITEIRSLLTEIKKEAINLRQLFWTEEELEKNQQVLSFFDARMQATVYYTLKNMEGYQQQGWKQLVNEGECIDDSFNFIQKKKQ